MSYTQQIESLTLEGALVATQAAAKKAKELSTGMNIAIVDASCHLLSFQRLPESKITSIDIAISKAFTAAGHRAGTHVYKDNVWPGGVAYGINHSNDGRFMTIAGGLPIKNAKGVVIGAIGCSTALPSQDQEVAQAGVDAIEKYYKNGPKAKL